MTHHVLTVPVSYKKGDEERTRYSCVGAVFENVRRDTGEIVLTVKLDFPVGGMESGARGVADDVVIIRVDRRCAFHPSDGEDLPVKLDLGLCGVGIGGINPEPSPLERVLVGERRLDRCHLVERRNAEDRLGVQDLKVLLHRLAGMHHDLAEDRRRDDDLLFVVGKCLDQILDAIGGPFDRRVSSWIKRRSGGRIKKQQN